MSESDPIATPFENGGRDNAGKFKAGNQAAAGSSHPHARQAAQRRADFWKAIRDSDVQKAVSVIRKIMLDKNAKPADRLNAARELLDRCLGRTVAADEAMMRELEILAEQLRMKINGEIK